MTDLILRIYDLLRRKPLLGWTLFVVLTAGLVTATLTLSYKEDITDFLPLDDDNQVALAVYQEISGANKLYAIITPRDTSATDPDTLTAGVERFAQAVTELDTLHYMSSMTKTVDMDSMASVTDNVYGAIPFYLTEADFQRIDSLLSTPGYVEARLQEDKQLLMFPTSAMVGDNVAHDPLGLFTPVLGRLRQGGMPIQFEMYDGYILSPEGDRAIMILESRFGAHESDNNARLVAMLTEAAERVENESAAVEVHVIGGPAIAVTNATRIKTDSILAVCIAGVLIMALLIYVFRNVWNILLILVSVGWGWLFAMGCIALYYDSVSIIVIGIASVILGIAVNYPLHLIDHLKDSPHPRTALREIVSPLVIGNVTTVGAFLCLVPLNSPALHDLGLFSSLLLVGTILFVLTFLPHAIRIKRGSGSTAAGDHAGLIARIAAFKPESSRTVVIAVVALTCVFAFFSTRTRFDSDMRNINYMTLEQHDDLAYFQSLVSGDSLTESVYVVSSGSDMEQALVRNETANAVIDSLESEGLARRHTAAADFLHSQSHREQSLERWHELTARHRAVLTDTLAAEAGKAGFSPEAFAPFTEIISRDYDSSNDSLTQMLAATVFAGNVSRDEAAGRHSVVQTLDVPAGKADTVKDRLKGNRDFCGTAFDVRSMNGSIADTLSDDFNYIGIACGCIVFLFLWLSFGRIELAIVSFLPMAVSWVWILGIMGITGITFNIVNVILATFIFGQGDDYTIFITEGLSYEFAYRRKLLASYKNSIIVSALIMFIGIGTLIFAKHPALRSLGEVTVVGMLSVVLMAWLIPPLVFNRLVRHADGRLRYRPITLRKVICTGVSAGVFLAQLVSGYVIGFVLFVLTRPTPQKRLWFRRYACSLFRFDARHIPGVRVRLEGINADSFRDPAVIICNHQSLLDTFCMLFISPKIVLLANEHVRLNPVIRPLFKWCSHISVSMGAAALTTRLRRLVAEGYSIAVFPEGERPREVTTSASVMRFHRGAFLLAEELGLDIQPLFFYGIDRVMPKGSPVSNGGLIHISLGERVTRTELDAMGDFAAQAREMRSRYKMRLEELHRRLATPQELRDLIYDRYIYKGREIEMRARQNLKRIVSHPEEAEAIPPEAHLITVSGTDQGERALLLAVMHPHITIECIVADRDTRALLRGCAEGFAPNLRIMSHPNS